MTKKQGHKHAVILILRDAFIIIAVSAAAACVVNFFRSDSLPWIAARDYEVLVPCPEPMGEATAVDIGDFDGIGIRDLLIDARGRADYDNWHRPDSIHIAFDYLEPLSDEAVGRIALTKAQRIIVAGDGGDPDSGEQLAREIAGKGIKNVYFIVGGMAALKNSGQ